MAYIVTKDKKEIMIYNKEALEDGVLIDEGVKTDAIEDNTEAIIEVETVEIIFNAAEDFQLALKAKKEEEEKERKERAAYWELQRQNGYYQNYNSGNYAVSEGDFRDVYFYEWSNVNGLPKRFPKVSEFEKWADENGVFLSEATKKELKTHLSNYVTCHEGQSTVIVKHNLPELKAAFNALYGEGKKKEEEEKAKIVNTTIPPRNAPMTGTPIYPTNNPYDDYDEDYYMEQYGHYY